MGVTKQTLTFDGLTTQTNLPGVYAGFNYDVPTNSGVSLNNGVIIGDSLAGAPFKLMAFASKEAAKQALVGGPLFEGICHAFDCSTSAVPSLIYGVSANQKTPGTRAFKQGSNILFTAQSTVYGVAANSMSSQLTKQGNNFYTLNFFTAENSVAIKDIGYNLFTILASTGDTLSIDQKSLNITFADEDEKPLTIDLAGKTVTELVALLQQDSRLELELLDETVASSLSASALDELTAINLAKVYTATAHMQALMDAGVKAGFFAEDGFAITKYALPDADASPMLFSGATSTDYTLLEVEKALAVLEAEDMQFVATTSENAAVHSLINQHCVAMSQINRNDRSRQAIVGGALGMSVEEAIAAAKLLNSMATLYIYLGHTKYDYMDSSAEPKVKQYSAAMGACMTLGLLCTLAVNESLTGKEYNVLDIEKVTDVGITRNLTEEEMQNLISAGVIFRQYNQNKMAAAVRAVTTFQGTNLIKNEASMVRELFSTKRYVAAALAAKIGKAGTLANYNEIARRAEEAINDCIDAGYITSFDQFSISVNGDKVVIKATIYLVAPINFIVIDGVASYATDLVITL